MKNIFFLSRRLVVEWSLLLIVQHVPDHQAPAPVHERPLGEPHGLREPLLDQTREKPRSGFRIVRLYLVALSDLQIELQVFIRLALLVLDPEEVEGLVEGQVEAVLAAHVHGRALQVAVGHPRVH